MNEQNEDFWNRHSLNFLEMAFDTSNREVPSHPDGFGQKTGECGDTVAFYLMMDQGRLAHISFSVQGCLNTTACCNTVVRMARGKSLDDAWEVTPEAVADFLKTLPEDHLHCAELAVGGFFLALSDYQKKARAREEGRPDAG